VDAGKSAGLLVQHFIEEDDKGRMRITGSRLVDFNLKIKREGLQ
jgi:hypothetical protein